MVFEIKQQIELLLQKKLKINKKEIAYLQARLTRLKEITQTIIQIQEQKRTQKYYFNDGMSLEEIAKVFKITRERVRQIEATALTKIKHPKLGKKLREYIIEQ
jgi:RNA polymerase primary sigma factor